MRITASFSIWTDLGRESITEVLGLDCDSFVVAGHLRTPPKSRPFLNGWHLDGGTDKNDLGGDIEAYILEFADRMPDARVAIPKLQELTQRLEVWVQFAVRHYDTSLFLALKPETITWLKHWNAELGLELVD